MNTSSSAASSDAIVQATEALAREGTGPAATRPTPAADPVWAALRATGTRLWLDTGDLEEAGRQWAAEFEALTTNNTLLNREVQKGLYDAFIPRAANALRAAVPDIDERRLLLEIAFVLNARHGLALVERFGAFVSVELHTDLAHDVERTVAYGRRFHALCPDRFIVKVPLTPDGLLGARQLALEGIPINFTLGFSARQNHLAARLTRPAYVNVFMGRLNAFVADNQLGDGKNVGEKATLATQRDLIALREAGLSPSRLIGASMRDGTQAASLAGLDVFTMPPKVAAEFRAQPPDQITSHVADDPEVTTADGVRPEDFAVGTLWEIPDAFRACVDELAGPAAETLSPATLCEHLARGGFPDLFPDWSEEDLRAVQTDGKIPKGERWKDRLGDGSVGLDALMNLSALQSFVADQAALDDRIRAHLA